MSKRPTARFNPLLGADQVDKFRDVARAADTKRQHRLDEEEIIMAILEDRK